MTWDIKLYKVIHCFLLERFSINIDIYSTCKCKLFSFEAYQVSGIIFD